MNEATLGNLVYFIRAQNQQFKQVVNETKDQLKGLGAKFEEGKKKTQEFGKASAESTKQYSDAIKTMAISASVYFATITAGIKKATDENMKLKNSLTGLSSVAVAFKQDVDATKKAAIDLASDGLMTVADAANGLKNLLASGFNLEQSIRLMDRFKDIASFNRQASLGFGEAIRGATEGIKNGNSILVDNIGLTKNLSIIMKEAGYSEQDVMKVTSDLNIRMAMFNGLMKETAPYIGDASKMAQMLSGQMAKVGVETSLTAAAIGDALEPSLSTAAGAYSAFLKSMRGVVEESPGLVAGIAAATTAIVGLVAITSAWIALDLGKNITLGLSALLTSPWGLAAVAIGTVVAAIIGLSTAAQKAKEESKKLTNTLSEQSDKYGQQAEKLSDLVDSYKKLKKEAKDSKEAHSKLNNVVKDIGKIAPTAITKWNDLGEAISININKAADGIERLRKLQEQYLRAALASAKYDVALAEGEVSKHGGEKGTEKLNKELAKRTESLEKSQEEEAKFNELYMKWRLASKQGDTQAMKALQDEAISNGWLSESLQTMEGLGLYDEGQWLSVQDKLKSNVSTAQSGLNKIAKKGGEAAKAVLELNQAQLKVASLQEQIDTLGKPIVKKEEETQTNTNDKRTPYQEAKDKFEIYARENRALEDQLKYWKEIVGAVKKTDKEKDDYLKKQKELENELTDAIKKEQDNLALTRKEGYEKELLALNQKEEEELKTVAAGSEREKLIRERYRIERENLTKKWDAETKAQQKELEAALLELKGDFENAARLREEARYARESSNTELSYEQQRTLLEEHQQKLLEITNEYAGKRAETALALEEAKIDSQISELEGQKEILSLHWNQTMARREALQIEREIINLQIKKIDLEIAELERQKKIAEEKNNQVEADKRSAEIAGLKTERDELERERDYNDKQYVADLSNDLKSNFSSAVQTGLTEGGKKGVDSLVDYLRQKAKERIADIITEAFFNSQTGKNMELWFTSAFGGSGQGGSSSGGGGGLFGFLGSLFGGGKSGGGTNSADLMKAIYAGDGAGATAGAAASASGVAGASGLAALLGGPIGMATALYSILPPELTQFGLFGLLEGLFGGGSKSMTIQASTANMEIDFATANFKEVTLPSSYMGRGVPSSNAVATVYNVNVNVNAAGSLLAEKDLDKRIKGSVQTGIAEATAKSNKWQSVTAKEG